MVLLTPDPEEGGYSVRCLTLPASRQGETEQEAIDHIIDAIEARPGEGAGNAVDGIRGAVGIGTAENRPPVSEWRKSLIIIDDQKIGVRKG